MSALFNDISEELHAITVTSEKLRSFGYLFAGIFLFFSIIATWKGWSLYCVIALSFSAVCLALCGAWAEFLLTPFYLTWMGLSAILGSIAARIIFPALFFIVMVPIALFKRMFTVSSSVAKMSNWTACEQGADQKKKMEQLF